MLEIKNNLAKLLHIKNKGEFVKHVFDVQWGGQTVRQVTFQRFLQSQEYPQPPPGTQREIKLKKTSRAMRKTTRTTTDYRADAIHLKPSLFFHVKKKTCILRFQEIRSQEHLQMYFVIAGVLNNTIKAISQMFWLSF